MTIPKALLFDVFGTVVDWRTSLSAMLTAFFEPRGVQRDWERFVLDWRSLYQPAMQAVRSGQRGFVVLDVLHAENLSRLLDDYDIGDLAASEREYLVRCWHRLEPWPDSVAGLLALRQRHVLATLSNGNVALMVALARHGGLPWDAILGAEFAADYKPNPVVYTASARALGCRPDECLMVAAHNADLRAARSLGFGTAYVNRPTEYGPDQTTDLGAEEEWDYVCDSMPDLAAKLYRIVA